MPMKMFKKITILCESREVQSGETLFHRIGPLFHRIGPRVSPDRTCSKSERLHRLSITILKPRDDSSQQAASRILWSSSRVGLITRERVGGVIHQYCGTCSMIPFLDFDTAGFRMYQQEDEQTGSETVYVCKDGTNNVLLRETPRQNSNRLFT